MRMLMCFFLCFGLFELWDDEKHMIQLPEVLWGKKNHAGLTAQGKGSRPAFYRLLVVPNRRVNQVNSLEVSIILKVTPHKRNPYSLGFPRKPLVLFAGLYGFPHHRIHRCSFCRLAITGMNAEELILWLKGRACYTVVLWWAPMFFDPPIFFLFF